MIVVQRVRAIASIDGERSSAVIWDIGGVNVGERSLTVLRPVPLPNLCYISCVSKILGFGLSLALSTLIGLRAYSVIVTGLEGGRRANACEMKPGRRQSSRD